MHVNVAIIGLDRRSTSIGLALKRYQAQPGAAHSFTIIGSDLRPQAMKAAEKLGAVDNFNRALLKATDNADLIFLNVPYNDLEDTYTRLGPSLKRGAVVIDLAELKQPSIEWAHRHFPKKPDGVQTAYLVGVTPVVNVHALYSGELEVEGARADLFDEAEFLVVPDVQCPSEAIELAEDVIRLLGGKPRFMDPLEHDGLIAATEELPIVLGITLFHTLSRSEGWFELRRMVNPTLALMIQHLRSEKPADLYPRLQRNRANLVRHLEAFIGMLDQVHDLLEDEADPEKLEIFLGQVSNEWDKWDVKRHSGKWEDAQATSEAVPGPLGTFGGFLNIGRRREKPDADKED